ncbi:DUF1996 and WSC domain-containing protein [Aspergillus lucknowensis]|uniref:WSC domain-containing protein n=1 Tax=Aspergillus lucknowensis TaxID=176173 RepID=A0ABR4LL79_9EURO
MRAGTRHLPLFFSCLELASAFFKVPCSTPLVVERADPIVDPGLAAGHVHTIMGGSGFGFTMDYNQTQESQCSSCSPKADKSNYWIPTLYYQAENGSFTQVPQNGGALIYYLQRPDPNNDTILAPPKDLRMVAGSPYDRKYKDTPEADARSYACLDYDGPAREETNGLPNYNCPDGLRSQVFFPSCWDGVNYDSPDHRSHMAYPETYNGGACPASHPVKIVSIFIEVIWRTEYFEDMWYGDSQPFLFSNGDPTGYGFHGDFVNGWDVDILQEAINTCDDEGGDIEKCAVLALYEDTFTSGCILEPSIDEKVTGWLDALPGCNPVQAGPEDAKPIKDCGAPTEIGKPQHYYTDVTGELEWAWIGCTRDNVDGQRVLSEASSSGDDMTVQKCIRACEADEYTYAGVEYARECYCGNSIDSANEPAVAPMG